MNVSFLLLWIEIAELYFGFLRNCQTVFYLFIYFGTKDQTHDLVISQAGTHAVELKRQPHNVRLL